MVQEDINIRINWEEVNSKVVDKIKGKFDQLTKSSKGIGKIPLPKIKVKLDTSLLWKKEFREPIIKIGGKISTPEFDKQVSEKFKTVNLEGIGKFKALENVTDKLKVTFEKTATGWNKITEGLRVTTVGGGETEQKTGQKQLQWGKELPRVIKPISKLPKELNVGFNKLALTTGKMLSMQLPLMFSFMQLGKEMKNALTPAEDMLGINELYQQFLALKYLPVAEEELTGVLDLGDAWGQLSDDQKYAQGKLAQYVYRMSDAIAYAQQFSMALGAIGNALLPLNIHLEFLGTGIETSGQQLGAMVGELGGMGTALMLLSTKEGRTMVDMGGTMQASGIIATDWLGKIISGFGGLTDSSEDTNKDVQSSFGGMLSGFGDFGTAITIGIPTILGELGKLLFGVNTTSTQIANDGLSGGIFMDNLNIGLSNQKALDENLASIKAKFAATAKAIAESANIFGVSVTQVTGGGTITSTINTVTPTSIPSVIPSSATAAGGFMYTGAGTSTSTMGPLSVVPNTIFTPTSTMPTSLIAASTYNPFRMAEGGIVRRPTNILAGESGPEAIIPLGSYGKNVTINNPVINLNSVAGKESTDVIVNEIMEKLGMRLTGVGS